jgi:hypothetical protein
MVTEIPLVETPYLNLSEFCLRDWMKSEVYKGKAGTRGELLVRVLDAAARVEKREDQLRRTTRDLRTRVAKCFEVDGWDFRTFIVCEL